MTTCGSPLTCGFRSTTTRPNATSGWSRSSRRCPAACARWPAPRTSPRCAPTWPPRPSTAAAPSTSSPNSPAETSGSQQRPEQLLGVTRPDADELAGEFPVTPREEWTETVEQVDGTEPKLVFSPTPAEDIYLHGHSDQLVDVLGKSFFAFSPRW